MIAKFIDFLINGAFSLVDTLISVLTPSSTLDYSSQLSSLMNNQIVQAVLAWINYFIPITTAGIIITTWGGVMLAYFAFKLVTSYGKAAL